MTFKERAVAALEEHLKGTSGIVKATIMDCLTIVRQVPELDTNTFACTGEKCPMQLGLNVTKCTAHNCQYRTIPRERVGSNDGK